METQSKDGNLLEQVTTTCKVGCSGVMSHHGSSLPSISCENGQVLSHSEKVYGEKPPLMQWTEACGFNKEQGKREAKDTTQTPLHPHQTTEGINIKSQKGTTVLD